MCSAYCASSSPSSGYPPSALSMPVISASLRPVSSVMPARRWAALPSSCAPRNTRWTSTPRSCSFLAVSTANAAPEEWPQSRTLVRPRRMISTTTCSTTCAIGANGPLPAATS